MSILIKKAQTMGMTKSIRELAGSFHGPQVYSGSAAYDGNLPLTAEEAWYQKQFYNPSHGRLPPNVARKAKARMARRKWVLCDDGIYRFKMQPIA